MRKYNSYIPCPSVWNESFPSHWDNVPMFAIAKEKSICDCIDLPLLSVYLDTGVVPFTSRLEKRANATSKDLSKYQRVDVGDFVLNNQQAWRGSVGISFHTGIVSPAYIVLSMNSMLADRYANYLLRSHIMVDQYLINSKGVGSIQRNIYWPSLKRTRVVIPPREEQDQIVRFLDWKVSSVNRLINIRKKQVRVIGELKEKIICRTLLHGIDPGVSQKNIGISWLGSIPAHWEVIKIKWLFDETDKRNSDGSADLLTFSKKLGLIPFSEVSEKKPSASDLSNYKIIHKGQLLENRMQAWHGMFIHADKDGCVSPDYSVFSASKERELNVKFYEYVFRSHIWVEQFANASRGVGSGFNRLYTPQFGSIYAVYPRLNEQNQIVEYLDRKMLQLNKLICQIEKRIECLEELKTTLISNIITGKIDVRDIEIPDYEYIEEEVGEAVEDITGDMEDAQDEE